MKFEVLAYREIPETERNPLHTGAPLEHLHWTSFPTLAEAEAFIASIRTNEDVHQIVLNLIVGPYRAMHLWVFYPHLPPDPFWRPETDRRSRVDTLIEQLSA